MLRPKCTGLQRQALFGALALLAVAVMILAGCYPGEISSVEELDLVVTLYDKDADFAALKTYAMPDSILHICDMQAQEQNCPPELTRQYDAQILSLIEQNLQSGGFTKVADPQQADVIVVVAANATDFYGVYYPWWWDWYYPYYPEWYYPSYAVAYEFTTGTLIIGMFDPDKAEVQNQRYGATWFAAINGLLGEGGNPQTRITTTINQAFAQSTYLRQGK